jgi:hypothetical protein
MKTGLVVLLCALCLTIGIIGGIWIVAVTTLTQHIPIIPVLSSPYPDNAAVKAQIEHDIPNWSSLDSYNLSTRLRMWSTAHTLHGGPDISTIYMPAVWHDRLYQHLDVFANKYAGVWCSGYSGVYEEVLDMFGYEAYGLSVGDYPTYTHEAELVKVNISGHEKFIIQDPYFECTYRWNNGTPISWLEMCTEMSDGRYYTFFREDTSVDDYQFTFPDIMGREIFAAPKDELLGNDTEPRGAWMYEYDISNNAGIRMTRDQIRAKET